MTPSTRSSRSSRNAETSRRSSRDREARDREARDREARDRESSDQKARGRRGSNDRDDEPIRPRKSVLRRIFRRLVLTGLICAVLLVAATYIFVRFAPVPGDRFPVQTTFIFDAKGHRLAALSAGENREVVALDKIPQVLRDAVVAAEDRRFYKHRGLDPLGIGRALAQDLRTRGRRPQGGSTITQQYVKNVYVGSDATVWRKLREAAVAVKLEQKLSKDEILQRYLNTIYFGRGAYGVQAASRAYFGVPVTELNLAQSAYLAAVIRSPERTDARKDLPTATRRRDSVLTAMGEMGVISSEQVESTKKVPLLGKNGVRKRVVRGTAYDYPQYGTQFFIDSVRAELVERFGEQVVQTQGLRVSTTIDLDIQKRAYESAYKRLLPDAKDPSAAVVVLDHDGNVKALVGGRDWDESKVNLAIGKAGGGRGRPAGSTFKPFVLSAVLKEGYSLESAFAAPAKLAIEGGDVLADTRTETDATDAGATEAGNSSGDVWVVRNTNNESYGTLNLVDATRQSVNTVFAQVVTNPEIGPQRVAEAAADAGIESDLTKVPSIALGTSEVGVLEMANSYLTFANRGERSTPTFLRTVTTADGRRLELGKGERKQVMRAEDADQINAVLQRVVQNGTGRSAAVPGATIAGKTGTTNDYRDAWFVGYTPKGCCVTAVWIGYPDSNLPMNNVHGVKVSGGTFPAKLFAQVMSVAVRKSEQSTGKFAKVSSFGGELLSGADRIRTRLGDGAGGPSSAGTRKTSRKRKTTGDSSKGGGEPVGVNQPALETVAGGERGGEVPNPAPAPVPVEPTPDPAPDQPSPPDAPATVAPPPEPVPIPVVQPAPAP